MIINSLRVRCNWQEALRCAKKLHFAVVFQLCKFMEGAAG